MDLGIDLTATTLKEYALAQGIEKSYAEMSQAEKVMLRYRYLMDVTSKQQGDFARTSTSMANSMRVFHAYAQAVKEALGQGLVAALRHVVHYLNVLLKGLLTAAKAFKIFMETLFGANISGGGFIVDTSEWEEVDDYMDDAADAAQGTADGVADAADSAKKLRKELSVLPFDELNQLNKDQEQTSSTNGKKDKGTGGSIGDLGDIDIGSGIFDKLREELDFSGLPTEIYKWAEKIKNAFLLHNWGALGSTIAWGINQGIQKIFDILDPEKFKRKVDPYLNAITTTFNSLVNNIDWNTLGRTMARGLNDLLYIANEILTKTDWRNLGSKLADWANGLVYEVEWDSLGQFFANKLNVFWETAAGFFRDFEFDELGQQFADGLWGFVSGIDYDAIVDTFIYGLEGLATALLNFGRTFPWSEAVALLVSHVNDFIDRLPTEQLGEAVGEMINHLSDAIYGLVNPDTGINFEELGKKLASGLMEMIRTVDPNKLALQIEAIFSGAWGLFRGFITGLDPTDVGNRLLEVFRTMVRDLDTAQIADDLLDLVHRFATIVKIFFGDKTVWNELGQKIGSGLAKVISDPQFASDLTGAFKALVDALWGLVTGAIGELAKPENKDKIASNFKKIFVGIPWDKVLAFLFPLVGLHLLNGFKNLALAGVRQALITRLAALFTSVGTASEITTASQSVFGGFVSALGDAATPGTVIGATVLAMKAIRDLHEVMAGGNGIGTEAGGAYDAFIEELVRLGRIGDETREKLWQLKESWEIHEIDDVEFFRQFAEILDKTGMNAEEAQNYVRELSSVFGLTDEQVRVLTETIGQMSNAVSDNEDVFEEFGTNTSEVVGLANTAINEMFSNLNDPDNWNPEGAGKVQDAFNELIGKGADFSEAIDTITEKFGLTSTQIGVLRQTIDEKLGEGAFDSFMSGANHSAESVEGIGEGLITTNGIADILAGKMTTVGENAENAQGKLDHAQASAEGVNETVNESPSLFETLKTIASGFFSNLLTLFPKKNKYEEKMKLLFTGIQNAFTSDEASTAQEKYDGFIANLSTVLEDANLGETAETTVKAVPEAVSDVMTGTEGTKAVEDTEELFKKMHDVFGEDEPKRILLNDSAETAENIPKGIQQGLEHGESGVTSAAERLAKIPQNIFVNQNRIHSPSGLFIELAENIGAGIEEGLRNSVGTVTSAMTEITDNLRNTFVDGVNGMTMDAYNAGDNFTRNGLLAGIRNGFSGFDINYDIQSILQSAAWAISNASQDFYNAGANLGRWFSAGFQSVHIPVPNLYVSWWDTIYNGDGSWFQIPRWAVNWNAKGGLFTRATVLQGFGEDGDEAALPLERKSTMSKIASAIMDNYNGEHGLTKDDVMEAVTYALANNAQNQPPIQNIVTVYTEDNEVLARAVQRGNQSMDYRNNATPRYSY